MELKVWVEGVVRVVCGLSLNTPCQDVVIALAQSIGQTGRYILISKLRGNERHLVADDCPLQHLAQLGQLAAEVQFILRRTGPSLSEGQDTPSSKRRLPLLIPSEPEPIKHKLPQKALTFNLGPSTIARRTKPNGAWSPSPRASPEPQTSPVSFLELPPSSVKALSSHSYKEDVFNQILQQQRRLEDLEIQLQALERESDSWEQKISSAVVPSQSLNLPELLEELEQQLRQNEEELRLGERLEEQFQAEMERERDVHRRLQQIHSSMEEQSYEMREIQTHSAHLEKDLQLRAHRQSPQLGTPLPEEALRSLNQELHNRLQLGEELDATLSKTERALQSAEKRTGDPRGSEQGAETV
ncbi:ras association domain-containing protein 8-like isoform X4 [Mugil cephalus]|uniref:ras association domain-containing protein 8-like isoform X4 n=1 Tax=Mugil cephalus TaxID=48193 RepID=UPI001FB82D63|nr:ras association domain-containing protein 8-like isoform X4 [Mugil cephalus]